MKVSEIKQKGIEYCDSIKNNCVRCPLAEKICVSAPYGIIQMPDRKMDFEQFAKDFKYMISEIYEENKDGEIH